MENQVQVKFDQLAAEYAAKYEHPATIFSFEKTRRLGLLVEYAQWLEPASVLDAGCGPGTVLSVLSRRLPHAKLAGVDLSYSMLRQAQPNSAPKVPLIQSLVEQLPFIDNAFDLISALGVMDYVENPPQFFQTVQRILKPGGCFIFTYPNRESIPRTLYTTLRTYFGHSRRAVYATPCKSATVDRWITDYGFKLIRRHFITYSDGLIALPWSVTMSRKMEKWCDQRPISHYLAWSCFCIIRKI